MKNLIAYVLLFTFNLSWAQNIDLTSQAYQTQVIELFTSEGCSSCPPADRWISGLKDQQGLWESFIPVVFHVDYWDYIGWKDPYALHKNTSRQRTHKSMSNINSVYTPGVLKAGKEWRYWRNATPINESKDQVGQLKVQVHDQILTAEFDSIDGSQNFKLNAVLLAMDVSTKVKAGENKGKLLKHDFVVLKQHSFFSNKAQWEEQLDAEFFKSNHSNTAFVVWVEYINNPAPIQAVGTLL